MLVCVFVCARVCLCVCVCLRVRGGARAHFGLAIVEDFGDFHKWIRQVVNGHDRQPDAVVPEDTQAERQRERESNEVRV
jgi:hypothetical protein